MSNLLCSWYIFHTVTVASVSVWFCVDSNNNNNNKNNNNTTTNNNNNNNNEPRKWLYPSWLVHLKLFRRMQRSGMGGWVCLTFLEVHSCQLSFVLLISCGKCCVAKLRKASMSWLRTPRKYQRTEEDHAIIITVTTTMTTAITKTIYCSNGNRIEWSPIHAVCNHTSGH